MIRIGTWISFTFRYTGEIVGHHRTRRLFENAKRFADFWIPSPASGERTAMTRAIGGGQSPAPFPQEPLRAQSLDDRSCGITRDAARPPAKGWSNYSI
jgi:hypothetical protein